MDEKDMTEQEKEELKKKGITIITLRTNHGKIKVG